jgi:hypothetical protein
MMESQCRRKSTNALHCIILSSTAFRESETLSRISIEEHLFRMAASVVSWSEFLATDPDVRARFPPLPDFLRSSGIHSSSRVQLRSYLEENVAASV